MTGEADAETMRAVALSNKRAYKGAHQEVDRLLAVMAQVRQLCDEWGGSVYLADHIRAALDETTA